LGTRAQLSPSKQREREQKRRRRQRKGREADEECKGTESENRDGRAEKSINGDSDTAPPDQTPSGRRRSCPTVPNPTRAAVTLAAAAAHRRLPEGRQADATRCGAGRVAPRKRGSEAAHRSGAGPEPTAAPLLIAAVSERGSRWWDHRPPRLGVSSTCGGVERSLRMRRRPHAVASHLN
jgi:hypothetical protein